AKNKISIILPCHRVIGADGSLTGYGGGMWRKKKLLEFEKENLGNRFSSKKIPD
ncbi:MAG: MGMT family protein, partial [Tannerellaceae bacterium]|nr:MGMT family protein [Tannerellaceae bacterium]